MKFGKSKVNSFCGEVFLKEKVNKCTQACMHAHTHACTHMVVFV